MQIRWGKEKKPPAVPKKTAAPTKPEATASIEASGVRKAAAARPVRSAPRPAASAAEETSQSLEEVLLAEGTISPGQLKEALEKQKESNEFLGQILIDLGFINENSLTSFLAKHCKIPHLSLLDYLIDTDLLELIPKEVCLEYRLVPIDKMAKNLTIAMVNPLDQKALAKVRELCPTLRIKPILCAYSHYQAVTEKVFAKKGNKSGEPSEMSATSFGLSPLKTKPSEAKAPAEAEPLAEPVEAEVEVAPEAEPLEAEVEVAPEAEPVEAEVEVAPEAEPLEVEVEVAPEAEPLEVEVEVAPEAEPLEADSGPEPEPVEAASDTQEVEVDDALDGDTLLEVFMGNKEKQGEEEQEEDREEAAAAPKAPAFDGDSSTMMQEMLDVMRDSMRDTYAVLARRMELFRGLSSEEVAKVFASGMSTESEEGATIFKKGDQSDELYVVLGGKVEIQDGDRVVATLGPGDLLGEMAWISDEPRSATAVAVETTSLITLSDDVFENLVSKEAAIQLLMNIVLMLTERLRQANEPHSG